MATDNFPITNYDPKNKNCLPLDADIASEIGGPGPISPGLNPHTALCQLLLMLSSLGLFGFLISKIPLTRDEAPVEYAYPVTTKEDLVEERKKRQ